MKRPPRRDPVKAALALQRAAAREGFDWPARDPRLWRKLHEEIRELRADAGSPRRAAEELGDLLFMVVNLARHLRLDPARALAIANRKFARRYGYIQRRAKTLPPLGDARRLDAMERLWREAKRTERKR